MSINSTPAEQGVRLDIQAVDKSYGVRKVLRNTRLTIEPGQFVAIVGRSGCGKSTLLRLVAGLESVTRGSITLGSQAVSGLSDDTRIMFQESRLLPWRRVIDNVTLGLPPERRADAVRVLEQVGLGDRLNDWPSKLSGGQRQRVALARALVHQPRLLLLDEPLGALDALTRIEMQQLIENLWRKHGFTVLLVTHDVSEAVAIADRVILIEDGEIGLDLIVDLPRPRARGSHRLAALEAQVLNRVLSLPGTPPEPEPVSPLPTQLRWAQ